MKPAARMARSLPPHWFLDAAATTIAIEDPIHVRDARHVLGHTSLATTERHYNQARGLEASRRHQAVLAGLHAKLKRGSG
jgi:integrase/recombinase XerD